MSASGSRTNPAKRLWYSKENDNPGRPFLPSERTAIIRAAWACEDETIKWLWLLACFYGLGSPSLPKPACATW